MLVLNRENRRALCCSALVVVTTALFLGCSGVKAENERIAKVTGSPRKKVVPVKGTVTVNGTAEKGVVITVYDADGAKKIPIALPFTDENGEFSFTTYMKNDGLEPGEYRVTFEWLKVVNKGGTSFLGPDKLNGLYSDPLKSDFKLVVVDGQPRSDLAFDLTVK